MWLLVVVFGCGRFDFAPQQSADSSTPAPGDGAHDARDASPPDATLDPSLIAWWRMTELVAEGANVSGVVESADVVKSAAECGNGLAPCPTVVQGGHDGLDASQFDGTTTMLTAASVAALTDAKFTIAAWVYNDAANGGCYMTKGLGSGVYNSWALCNNDTNNELFFYTVTGSDADMLMPGNVVPNGSWHHVAATWDGGSKVLYLDGNKLGDDQPTGVDFDDDPVYIGADVDSGAGTSYLPGKIDDVRVYNRSLNGAEILTLAGQ
jgi:hypothetical protein